MQKLYVSIQPALIIIRINSLFHVVSLWLERGMPVLSCISEFHRMTLWNLRVKSISFLQFDIVDFYPSISEKLLIDLWDLPRIMFMFMFMFILTAITQNLSWRISPCQLIEVFKSAIPPYQEALKRSGYDLQLVYEPTIPQGRRKNRPRKIVWFNPPSLPMCKQLLGQFIKFTRQTFPPWAPTPQGYQQK